MLSTMDSRNFNANATNVKYVKSASGGLQRETPFVFGNTRLRTYRDREGRLWRVKKKIILIKFERERH